MVKAAVVIVHYKNDIDTKACLDSIFINHTINKQFYIIVVINSLQDSIKKQNSFASILKKEYPQLLIIENDFNAGFAQGNNMGIKKALHLGCEYIILLNNDTIVSLGLLDKLVLFAKTDWRVGLISPKIYFAKGFEYHKNRYKVNEVGKVIWYAGGIIDWDNIYPKHRGVDEVDRGQYDKVESTDFATGCCMLITRRAIEKAGFFDQKYFLYYEDVDFSERVKKIGMKIVYYPKTFLWHKNASSSGKPGSKLHLYYQNRNRLYFGFKYGSIRVKKSLFLDSLRLYLKGGVNAKSMADYFFGRMGQAHL